MITWNFINFVMDEIIINIHMICVDTCISQAVLKHPRYYITELAGREKDQAAIIESNPYPWVGFGHTSVSTGKGF